MPGNVIVDNPDWRLGTWNNVFIAVYRSGVTSDSVAREKQALSEFIDKNPTGVVRLTVILPNAKPPSPDVRPMMADLMKQFSLRVVANHIVILGSGFQMALIRAVLVGIVMRSSARLKIHGSTRDAVTSLLSDVVPTTGCVEELEQFVIALTRDSALHGALHPQNSSAELLRTLVSEVQADSDRAAVILFAAHLDDVLHNILEKSLRPSARRSDDLFDKNGALGTFSAKIELAYRLGLVDKQIYRALGVARSIRNDYAHRTKEVDWRQSLDDRISNLSAIASADPEFAELVAEFGRTCSPISSKLRGALTTIILRLLTHIEQVEPVNAGECCHLGVSTPEKSDH